MKPPPELGRSRPATSASAAHNFEFPPPPLHSEHRAEGVLHFAMATALSFRKALTAPPTVRTLASGVPSAPLINLSVRSPAGHGHGHEHGAVGPRSDAPAKFAGGLSISSSSGLASRSFASGASRCSFFFLAALCNGRAKIQRKPAVSSSTVSSTLLRSSRTRPRSPTLNPTRPNRRTPTVPSLTS